MQAANPPVGDWRHFGIVELQWHLHRVDGDAPPEARVALTAQRPPQNGLIPISDAVSRFPRFPNFPVFPRRVAARRRTKVSRFQRFPICLEC
jgi:hypothetical protein